MPDSTSLLHVTEGFYAAALGLGTWGDALDRFGDAVRADHLFLAVAGGLPFLATTRVDERDFKRALELWPVFERDGPRTDGVRSGEAVLGRTLMPDEDYVRTAHYNELVRPLGGRYAMFGRATTVAPGSAFYACRGAHRPDFEAGDADMAAQLLPHLSLALAVAARFVHPGSGLAAQDSLLAALDDAALLSDDAGRLLGANAAARALIEAADGIALSTGRLVAMTPKETGRLRRAIAEAAGTSNGSPAKAARIRLPRRPGRLPLSLRLVPAGNLGPVLGDPRSVAIFVTEPDAALPIDRSAITEAFGLAPREAELACFLASGASVADIAATTGLRIGSVRVYLKRIFDKTGARSQAALVALLRGFV